MLVSGFSKTGSVSARSPGRLFADGRFDLSQDKLLELTDEIDTRLEYFQELEHATRMLNHPGESLVLQTDFLYMVERVDICIEYLKAHVRSSSSQLARQIIGIEKWHVQRYYKEAEVYLLRFQQCMTRAMTLIKMFFVGSLRALSADVSKRLSEKVAQSLLPCTHSS